MNIVTIIPKDDSFMVIMMRRMIPPSASPLSFRDLVSSGLSALHDGNGAREDFTRQFSEYLDEEGLFFISSGKAAIYLVLRSLQQTSARRRVIIPAYTS